MPYLVLVYRKSISIYRLPKTLLQILKDLSSKLDEGVCGYFCKDKEEAIKLRQRLKRLLGSIDSIWENSDIELSRSLEALPATSNYDLYTLYQNFSLTDVVECRNFLIFVTGVVTVCRRLEYGYRICLLEEIESLDVYSADDIEKFCCNLWRCQV